MVTRALILLIALAVPASGPLRAAQGAGKDARDVEHRYRVVGAVRLLLVWLSAQDVGGARISWQETGDTPVLSLLICSDPRRAPRSVNEWGYLRESTSGGATTVFGLRTLSDGDSPQEAEQSVTSGVRTSFGVLCSTVSPARVSSQTATVPVPRSVTYRDVGQVLSILEEGVGWKPRGAARPPGVAPGFLSAMDGVMRAAAAAAGGSTAPRVPSTTYVYRDAVYDLTARQVERVAQLRTRSGAVFENLLRTRFLITNRATRWSTDFWLTFGLDGDLAAVPVHARYQHNWWFRVELHLDETADAPADPADDPSVRERIDSICGNRS